MKKSRSFIGFNICFIVIFLTSLVGIRPGQAAAQEAPPQPVVQAVDPTPEPGDGLRYGYNQTTGKMNFVGGDAGTPLLEGTGEVSAMAAESAGETVLGQYASAFGIADPQRELELVKVNQSETGINLRYQQLYQGIPILGGEVLVNSDENGSVLSMNGEVSPNLKLKSTTPSINAEQARQAGLDGMKDWYAVEAGQVVATDPELVVYDEKILKPSDKPVTLAWKMEMRSDAAKVPVNELVLVDAFSGQVTLHFNQIDTSWGHQDEQPSETPTEEITATETPTEEPTVTETPTVEVSSTATPTMAATLTETPTVEVTDEGGDGEVVAETGSIRYVSTTGNDGGNNCLTLSTPCSTMDRAIGQAVKGDTIKVTVGTYTSTRINDVIEIWKGLVLSGGWNEDFNAQIGFSTIDGEKIRKGITVNTPSGEIVTINKFKITNGKGGEGAGIYVNVTAGQVIISQCSVTNNNSDNTGAIDGSTAGNLTIINTSITNNVTGGNGGAVYKNGNGNIYLQNVTIVNNAAVSGKGGGVYASKSKLFIKNSIIANNSAPTNPNCFSNSGATSQGYNLLKIKDKCVDTLSTGDIINVDPLMGPQHPDGYYILLPGSPVIDAGNPATPGSGGNACELNDLLGTLRPVEGNEDGNAICDIGSYETAKPAQRTPAIINILHGTPQNILLNHPISEIALEVIDQYGIGLSGVTVNFIAPSEGASGVFAGSGSNLATVITGNDGIAIAPVFTTNSIVGDYFLEASVDGLPHVQYDLENYILIPQIQIIAGDAQQTRYGLPFSTNLKVKVVDNYGALLKNFPVTFTAPETGPSGTFSMINDHNVVVSTDTSGYGAAPVFIANGISGDYTVEVSAENAVPVQFHLTNIIPATSLSVHYYTEYCPTNLSCPSQFEVIVRVGNGYSTKDIPVTFTAPESGPSGVFSGTGSSLIVLMTGSTGYVYTPLFIANGISGTFTIDVTAPGATPVHIDVENYSQIPNVSIYSGNNQYAGSGKIFGFPITAVIKDQHSIKMPNIPVTFTTSESDPGGIFVDNGTNTITMESDINGEADATLKSRVNPGSFNITASVDNGNSSTTFTLNTVNTYASVDGDDNNPINNNCRSRLYPCQTIAYAILKTPPGATLYLRQGTYTGGMVFGNHSYSTISGGWNEDYSSIIGFTAFLGENQKNTGIIYDRNSISLTFENLILDNFSTGIFAEYGVTIRNSIFRNNVIGISHVSNPTAIENCSFYQNSYGIKGSSYDNTTIRIVNSTFRNNYLFGIEGIDKVEIINSTIVDHPDIALELASYSIIQNSIFYNNAKVIHTYCDISKGNNYFDLVPTCPLNGSIFLKPGDIVGTPPLLSSDIQDRYLMPLPGSPLIDAIDPTLLGNYCPPTDQRGVSRPVGSKCDIGAIEYSIPGEPSQIIAIKGNNQVAGVMLDFTQPLILLVLDEAGTPVPGVVVTLRSPDSGPSGFFQDSMTNTTSSITNNSGRTTPVRFKSNSDIGNYQISLLIGGEEHGSISLTNVDSNMYVDQYVGNDSNNDCRTLSNPCLSIEHAINNAIKNDVIKIREGEYQLTQGKITIGKSLMISGGWEDGFVSNNRQTSISGTINDYFFQIPPNIHVGFNRLDIDGKFKGKGIFNLGELYFEKGTIFHTKQAIANYGYFELLNATISNNYDIVLNGYKGGTSGIYVNKGNGLLVNTTIAENIFIDADEKNINPDTAGGIYNQAGIVTFKNSILANNYSPSYLDCKGFITSLGSNIIGVTDGCFNNSSGDDHFGSIASPIDPLLADLDSQARGTMVHALMEGSPALGLGDPTYCPLDDQNDHERLAGVPCDIGASEGAITAYTRLPNNITISANHQTDYSNMTLYCAGTASGCPDLSDVDGVSAHRLINYFSKFIYDEYNRQSFDNKNSRIFSTIHIGTGYENAWWDGSKLNFGDGYPLADDIVAHEFTHGITQYESNLFYYYQSGSINESLSDLWGEYFDQTNGIGDDSAIAKWLIGENTPGGAFRNMQNPPSFNDPDRMTSVLYYDLTDDNGGVHYNSGVNNKAVYLMVDGGTFYGKTYTPIGWKKTGAIYYYANANLLTSGSDYFDLYNALFQACTALVGGQDGITPADCSQVRKATDAVEMNQSHTPTYNPDTDYCPTGTTLNPIPLFTEGFENGDGLWVDGQYVGHSQWGVTKGFAAKGLYAMFGNDFDPTRGTEDQGSDTYIMMKDPISIPSSDFPYLFFRHAFGFEDFQYGGVHYYFDGGILEYTVNNGETWADARRFWSSGQNYNYKLYDSDYGGENPLNGLMAFAGDSHGYVSSRYNLSSLAGSQVRFRWRMGTDISGSDFGWIIDDISIYTCVGIPATPTLKTPIKGSLLLTYTPVLDWNDAANSQHYELEIATDSGIHNIVQTHDDILTSNLTLSENLLDNQPYYWHVRSVNTLGVKSTWSSVWSFRTSMITPILSLPASGGTVDNLRPGFSWSTSPGATNYSIMVSAYSNFSSSLLNATVVGTSYIPSKDLTAGKQLYWKVRANGTNTSDWSTSFTFNTPIPPGIPALASPASNTLLLMYTPTLAWKPVTVALGAPAFASYWLQVANNPGFNSPIVDKKDITSTSFSFMDPLPNNSPWYWRVCSINVHGDFSTWSPVWTFRTALITPVLSLPATGGDVDSLRPDFSWSVSPGVVNYTIMVSANSNFSSPLVNTMVNGTNYTPTKDLTAGRTLFWKVKANGANTSDWSSPFTFNTPIPPGIPVLSAPSNNSLLLMYTPLLSWKAVTVPAGAPVFAGYELQVDDQPDFLSPVESHKDLTGVNYPITTPLADNKPWYWRVRSINVDGDVSSWSTVWTFRTALVKPVLDTPGTGTTVDTLRPEFKWVTSPGAANYTIVVSPYATLSSPVVNVTVASNSYLPTKDLPSGKLLYWRVKANGTNTSDWSDTFTLTTPIPPTIPVLVGPASNALLTSYTPTLSWKAVTIPTGGPAMAHYRYQVDDDPYFGSPVVDLTTTSLAAIVATEDNVKYYWRVQSCNIHGDCSWWASSYFRSAILPPELVSPAIGALLSDTTPDFNWNEVDGATSYTIVISTNSNLSSPILTMTVSGLNYTSSKVLPKNKAIYWSVKANGTNGPGLFAVTRSFSIQ